jgi:5-methylthioadenosine/S-adenosylhomocysteine deaminase
MKTIIYNAQIKQPNQWINNGCIQIEDGFIFSISSQTPDEKQKSSFDQVIDAKEMALLPGFVNGHTHFSQTFMRGLAGGRPLLQWLKELIWPLQAEISVEEMQLAALLGLAENVRCGVTEVVNHHKITRSRQHTLAVKEAAEKIGLRTTIARAWANKGKINETDQQIMEELEEWYTVFQSDKITRFASGPLTPWRCSAELLKKTHQLSLNHNSFTHIHVSETAEEVRMTVEETGLRPVQWLDQIGVLDDHIQVVHAVWVDDLEIELLANKKATVVHCPVSNAVLGSGVAPVRKMLNQGVNLRLGTDGPASNDTQDCFENMKMALCLARATFLDANNLSNQHVLDMAVDHQKLTIGAKADLILVKMNNLHSAPVHDLDSALTMCSRGDDVDTVMVEGKIVLQNGKLTTIDEEVLLKECNQAINSLRKRAGISI